MPTPPTSDAELRATLEAFERNGRNYTLTGKELGLADNSVRGRVKNAHVRGLHLSSGAQEAMADIELPSFDDGSEPIEEIIERMARNFTRAKDAQKSRQWFPIKMPNDKPVGVLFVGDPHLDDNGCNWPILRDHVRLCKETDGLYAVNIGDVSNDWGGRLVKKYADQEATTATAARLVEWFLLDSGVSWLVWLHGNHQHMGGTMALHEQMNRRYGTKHIPMLNWEARFTLDFPSGATFRINAAHDFAGNSMWNPVHGAVKAAKFGNGIDVAVCGHKHNWAISQWEQPEQGNAPLMIRVRGYKHLDDYAQRIGKYEQEEGQSILVVFDPNAKTQAGRTQAFVDIEKGAAYLTALRRKG
jgi:hypothetical protein